MTARLSTLPLPIADPLFCQSIGGYTYSYCNDDKKWGFVRNTTLPPIGRGSELYQMYGNRLNCMDIKTGKEEEIATAAWLEPSDIADFASWTLNLDASQVYVLTWKGELMVWDRQQFQSPAPTRQFQVSQAMKGVHPDLGDDAMSMDCDVYGRLFIFNREQHWMYVYDPQREGRLLGMWHAVRDQTPLLQYLWSFCILGTELFVSTDTDVAVFTWDGFLIRRIALQAIGLPGAICTDGEGIWVCIDNCVINFYL